MAYFKYHDKYLVTFVLIRKVTLNQIFDTFYWTEMNNILLILYCLQIFHRFIQWNFLFLLFFCVYIRM